MSSFPLDTALPTTYLPTSILSHLEQGDSSFKDFLSTCSPATGESLNDVCAVCRLSLCEEPAISNPKCCHIFHRSCVELVLTSFDSCPLCRVGWDTEKVERQWAGVARETVRSLREDQRVNISLPDFPRFRERIGEILAGTVRLLAWSMQQEAIPNSRINHSADGYILRAMRSRDKEEMRWAANSEQGHRLVKCLLANISHVQVEDLYASHTDEVTLLAGLDVHCFPDGQSEYDVKWNMMQDRLELHSLEPGTQDVYLLAHSILMDSLEMWNETPDQDVMIPEAFLRFGSKLIVWSLIGCVQKLEELPAEDEDDFPADTEDDFPSDMADDFPAEMADDFSAEIGDDLHEDALDDSLPGDEPPSSTDVSTAITGPHAQPEDSERLSTLNRFEADIVTAYYRIRSFLSIQTLERGLDLGVCIMAGAWTGGWRGACMGIWFWIFRHALDDLAEAEW